MIEGTALAKTFRLRGRMVRAVQGVSLAVRAGEALGIVGELGCGKTTTARLLLRLEEPSGGRISFLGDDITDRRGGALKQFRASAQLVFQNPFDALNPRFTIRRALAEPLHNFAVPRSEHAARIEAVMRRVRLLPSAAWLDRRPHELSGGQLQRVVLARALLPQPRLIVADEPVSMLDVSVRAGILNLLREARDELDLAAIYISHDLALIRYVCERTMVMYLGRVVEEGPTAELIAPVAPLHPRAGRSGSGAARRIRIVPRCRSAAMCRKRRRQTKAARSAPAVRMPSRAARLKSRRCARSLPVAASPAIWARKQRRLPTRDAGPSRHGVLLSIR